MKRWLYCIVFFASTMVFANPGANDWAERGRSLLMRGGDLCGGKTESTGLYVLCVVPIPEPTDSCPASEGLLKARIAGKRLIGGFVSGEMVASFESVMANESQTTEGTDGNSCLSNEQFRKESTIGVDAMLRGVEQVAEIESEGGKYAVFLATEKAANAAAALRDSVANDGVNSVRASGFAPILGEEMTTAHDAALAAAKTAAIEMVLGTFVQANETSLSQGSIDMACASVCSRASGFIKSFRVEKDSAIGPETYQVVILAEIETNALEADFRAVLSSMGNLRFCVIDGGNPILNCCLEEALLDWNIPLVQNPSAAAYHVIYRVDLSEVKHPMDGRSGTRPALEIEILDSGTNSKLLVLENDPVKCISYLGPTVRQSEIAIRKGLNQMIPRLRQKLTELLGRMSAEGREIQILFRNCDDFRFESLEKVRARVTRFPSCSSVSLRLDATSNTATLVLTSSLDMDSFATYFNPVLGEWKTFGSDAPKTIQRDANQWLLSW